MLFRKKIQRSCAYCVSGTAIDDEQILCVKKGVVPICGKCRKFSYDPCKRIPPKPKAPDFSRYKEEDFKLWKGPKSIRSVSLTEKCFVYITGRSLDLPVFYWFIGCTKKNTRLYREQAVKANKEWNLLKEKSVFLTAIYKEKILTADCGVIKCCGEPEDAVTMVGTDVSHVVADSEDGMELKDAIGGITWVLESKAINASDYVL